MTTDHKVKEKKERLEAIGTGWQLQDPDCGRLEGAAFTFTIASLSRIFHLDYLQHPLSF